MPLTALPPLQWLPGFEAAARLLSFKDAAAELYITPAALGQQIKSLETWLGFPLFARQTRAVTLTKAGKIYYPIVADMLFAHERGFQRLLREVGQSTLRVSATAFMTQELLIPNMASFRDCYAGTDLRIETSMSLADFDRDPIDVALRIGQGKWKGLTSLRLTPISVAPVGSPALFEDTPLQSLEDLQHHCLIHASSDSDYWQQLRDGGLSIPQPRKELFLDGVLSMMNAASQGLGVALGLFPLINEWIQDGRLASPFKKPWPTPLSYYVVCRHGDEKEEAIQAFYHWAKALFEALPDVKPVSP